MKKAHEQEMVDELRPEYDLSQLEGGVRGKYAERFQDGTNLVLLTPDVARYFPDEDSVNAALRSLVGVAKAQLNL
ncbi:MAG TPA: hypothetical protein P5527_06340 [Kiritimatiellia bacterium]|jgi:hypothetical protein|nr:hypothetical protein [Kiritimatiellia bacterium]